MAKLDVERTRAALKEFDFSTLFIDALGWRNPAQADARIRQDAVAELAFVRHEVAQLAGAKAFLVWPVQPGTVFLKKERERIAEAMAKVSAENVSIFLDQPPTQQPQQAVWVWRKKVEKKYELREHPYMRGQPGDLFITKIRNLHVDLEEAGDATIIEVADKLRKGLDVEKVTKKFFKAYQDTFLDFAQHIEGFDKDEDRRWYASVLLNRLMFIYFLQQKGFVDQADRSYLHHKLRQVQRERGRDQFYSYFLHALFFDGFAVPEGSRSAETNALLGKIRYLNGGLFIPHRFENREVYPNVRIPDSAFELLLAEDTDPKGLFCRFSWTLNDVPGEPDNEINPDVLGYIFEKYINQKQFGAYYTRPEITEYLCEQTVNKLILDKLAAAGYRFDDIGELMQRLDARVIRLLVQDGPDAPAILPSISLLDPACGSGAFLVAAMKVLINLYSAVYGRIAFTADSGLRAYVEQINRDHPSLDYYIKKRIIAHNLFGVDIMEEATEIAKLRLFLALVSSAQNVTDLEPLPNIDFNIMCGNSLIGLLGVDGAAYNIHSRKKGGPVAYKAAHPAVQTQVFNQTSVQTSLLDGRGGMVQMADPNAGWKNYEQLVHEMELLKSRFRLADGPQAKDLKEQIALARAEANHTLDQMLLAQFEQLGIKYERQTWDAAKNKEGKPAKEALTLAHIQALAPFHWGYEFSEVFRKGGFDAIITNPPWEVLQTDEKEWFAKLDNNIQKKKLRIEDWKKQMGSLMQDPDIQDSWLTYASGFPHQSAWYKKSDDYLNMLGGKLNLFGLFTLRSYQLLRKEGYCGTVIPSGIYTDEGYKGLRKLLFEKADITGLFCFENKKEIFENVHRSFKFIVLSFRKGGHTESFPAAFMRHDTKELERFPKQGATRISLDFIKLQSPGNLSVMEVKNDYELKVIRKLLLQPKLGDPNGVWNIEFFGEEVNMTRGEHMFNSKGEGFPLFEGNMIWQYSSSYEEPRYYIKPKIFITELKSKKAKRLGISSKEIKHNLDHEEYRVGIRKIASSTNERTLITSIIPKNAFAGNSLTTIFPHKHNTSKIQHILSTEQKLYLLTFLNSFALDFYLRSTMTTNLNLFYLENLPIIGLNGEIPALKSPAARLICTTPEFAELWEEVMGTPWTPASGATDPAERNALRAELDARVAHLYGLTQEEFAYILTTFPLVAQAQKDAVMEQFIALAQTEQ